MKNSNDIELPELNIERDPFFLIVYAAVSLALGYFTYHLFVLINPWGFVLMVPSVVLLFQLVWFLLNPFAQVFKDRVELKRTLFSNKCWYFIDVAHVSQDKKGKVYITYNDEEVEPVNLFGIKQGHIAGFMQAFKGNATAKSSGSL